MKKENAVQRKTSSFVGRLILFPFLALMATSKLALGNEIVFSLDAYQVGFNQAAAQASELRQNISIFKCTQSLHQERFAFGLNPYDKFSSRYTVVRNDNQLVIVSIIARSRVEVQNLAVVSDIVTVPNCKGFTSTSDDHRDYYFF